MKLMPLGDVILVGWAHRSGPGNQSETLCLGKKKKKSKMWFMCALQRATVLSEPGEIEEEKENCGKNR